MSTGLDYWNQKYQRGEFVYGRRPNQFLVDHAPDVFTPAGQVLSLGEGEGRNAVWMACRGWQVTAVDYSRPALDKLKGHADREGVEIESHCLDVLDFDLGLACWDVVVLLHLHLLRPQRRALHRRIAGALRPGGVLLLEALRVDQLERASGGPESPDLLYTAQELRRDFADLDIRLLAERDRYIAAGEHRGVTSVVGFIGRR